MAKRYGEQDPRTRERVPAVFWSGTNKVGRLAFAERQIETLSAGVRYSLLKDEGLLDVVEQTCQGKNILTAELNHDAMRDGMAQARVAVKVI